MTIEFFQNAQPSFCNGTSPSSSCDETNPDCNPEKLEDIIIFVSKTYDCNISNIDKLKIYMIDTDKYDIYVINQILPLIKSFKVIVEIFTKNIFDKFNLSDLDASKKILELIEYFKESSDELFDFYQKLVDDETDIKGETGTKLIEMHLNYNQNFLSIKKAMVSILDEIKESSTPAPAPETPVNNDSPGPSVTGPSPSVTGPSPSVTGPSPSVTGPSPSVTGPSPSHPSPSPANSSVGYAPGFDYSNYGLNTPYLRKKIEIILDNQLSLNVTPKFREENNKLVIIIDNINYSSIPDDKKVNIEKLIQNEVHTYLHMQYKENNNPLMLVGFNRINVVAFTGSTYIVVQILPKKMKHELSNTDKDMLEFYNFMGVLNRGNVPIKETDYLQHHYVL